jgi:hypothetical protein
VKRFGAEPNQKLLRSVKIAKLIESESGITRGKIEHILQTGPSESNEYALKILEHLGWIQRHNKGFIWAGPSNKYSKLLWESDEVKQDDLSKVNLQFACWALLSSLRSAEIIPLPQIISVLMEKNFWIIKENESSNNFFVKYNNKLASESSTRIDLVQSTSPKLRSVLDNLNDLGLTRKPKKIRGSGIFHVHFEIPENLGYFLLTNLIFNFKKNPKITNILEQFNNIFGIIDNPTIIPNAFSECIFNLKKQDKVKFENPSSETTSFEIKDPFDYQVKERILRLRKFDD